MLLLTSSACFALNVKEFTFSHLGTKEGLQNQRISSICQTKDGSIWWATKRGVCRYNGTRVRNYSIGDETSYSTFAGRTVKIANVANDVMTKECLYAYDNSGHLFKYNVTQNRFDLVAEITKMLNVTDVVLNDAFITSNGVILAMREGIFVYCDGKVIPVQKGVYANCITTAASKIVVGTMSGVYYLSEKKGEKNIYSASKSMNHITQSVFFDAKTNMLWLGTFDQGLVVMKVALNGSTLKPVEMLPQSGYSHNPIRIITPYDDGTMLIGIDGYGVFETSRKNPKEGKLLFDANEGPNGVLHGNGVYSVLVDSWKNILVGTYSGGVDIARPIGNTTTVFTHTKNNMQSLINNHVNCVAEWQHGVLMMGTDDGVSIFNTSAGTWSHAARGMIVLDLCPAPDGKTLAATYGNGVCEISSDGQAKTIFSKGNGTLKDDHVYKLLRDKSGNLWMGCLFGQIAVKTNTGMKYYDIDNVQDMTLLPDGRVAVGTSHGLFIVNASTDKAEDIQYYPDNLHEASWFIFDLYASSANDLWIATDGGGLYRYNLKDGHCKQITTENGLPSNCVCNIEKDSMGRLWLGTDNGLAFIDPANPEDVVNVSHYYGLDREYLRCAVKHLSNGNILYGSPEGALIINPKNINKLNYTATLTVLGARHSQKEDEHFNERVHASLGKNTLYLNYEERSFELYYESINLRNQFDIAYQYKIGDGEWSKATKEQTLRFVNMEPGTHTLCIRSVSKASGVVLDEKTIILSISQPWWNSWWMWCFYIIMLVLAFIGAWKIYNLHNRYMRLVIDELHAHDDNAADEENPSLQPADEDSDIEMDEDIEDEIEESKLDSAFVDSVTKTILENMSNPNFSIDSLCSEMDMSRTLFYVKLKSYTGKSPQDFIRVIRLERAASMLHSGFTVSEVSSLVGFDNPKYFSTVFKKYFGVSPSKYV